MTVVLFVHGIGGRGENYDITYQKIKKIIKDKKPKVEVKPCLWGEDYGAKLLADGASIPDYEETGGTEGRRDEEFLEKRWKELYEDPFWEIRLLGYRADADVDFSDEDEPSNIIATRVEEFVKELTVPEFKTQMKEYGIYQFLQQACELIRESDSYDRWLNTVSYPLDEEYSAFARAIVAISINWLNELNLSSPILCNTELRDEAVNCLVQVLTKDTESRALGIEWITNFLEDKKTSIQQLLGGISGLIADHNMTPYMRKRRGAISDFVYPMAGDILVYQYQDRGQEIRDFIEHQIESQQEEPVILLAHSLGGVACVDLLAEKLRKGKNFSQVKLLITVGSQAPFFYEINALQSLHFDKEKFKNGISPLPSQFPEWLNIYDLNDVLSYVGAKLFPMKVKDVPVGNKQPLLNSHLLNSHVAYWDNEATWKAIFDTWETIEELR